MKPKKEENESEEGRRDFSFHIQGVAYGALSILPANRRPTAPAPQRLDLMMAEVMSHPLFSTGTKNLATR